MKAIIDDKLYDTDSAQKIYSYSRRVNKGQPWWANGLYWTPRHYFDLYRTAREAYFEHDNDDDVITLISKDDAMDIIRGLNPDAYCDIFEMTVEEG